MEKRVVWKAAGPNLTAEGPCLEHWHPRGARGALQLLGAAPAPRSPVLSWETRRPLRAGITPLHPYIVQQRVDTQYTFVKLKYKHRAPT